MVMTIFAPFIFFCLLNGLNIRLSGKTFGRCLPLTMLSVAFFMYFSQFLLGTFKGGNWILIAGILGSLIVIIKSWRESDQTFKDNFMSKGFWAFLAIYLIYLVVDFGRNFSAWDEFSHWGMMVKEMLRTDRFYSEPISHLLVHEEYPPFISIFEMLWCRICGRYSEMAVSMSIHILSLSLLVPWLAEYKKGGKKWEAFGIGALLTVIFILVISAFDVFGIFHTIYTDMIMPILYVYCMSLILTREGMNTGFGRVCLAVSLSALAISKQMAVAFVILVWLYYFLVLLTDDRGGKQGHRTKIWSAMSIILLPLANYMIWENYTSSLGLSGQFDLGQVNIPNCFGILIGKGTRAQVDTFKAYFDALFQRRIFSGMISMTYVSAFFVALFFLYLLSRFTSTFQKRGEAVKLGIVFVCGTLGYAFTMFVLYMFCFAEVEMRVLASFERYMDSYLVSEFLLLLISAVRVVGERREDIITNKNLAVLFVICIMILNPASLINLTPQIMKGKMAGMYYDCAMDIVEKTEDGSAVFILAASGMPQNEYYINYYADGRAIDLSRAYDAPDFLDGSYVEKVIETIGTNDYVFIMNTNQEMGKALTEITGGNNLHDRGVYKVEHREDGIMLMEVVE